MALAKNALTTLDAVKNALDIKLTDTTDDEFLNDKINAISADIIDYVRFDLSADYVLPKDDDVDTPRTLPYNIEDACKELVAIAYQRRGSEHLKEEIVGPLRSFFIMEWPEHIKQTLDRYRVWAMI